MTFLARYAGACTECDARIHIGDAITSTDDGFAHVQCSTPVDDDREPCPSCWLTICDCKADQEARS